MLRRRKKPPKVMRHATPGPATVPVTPSRRRARPDATVPQELRIRPAPVEQSRPPAPKQPAQKPPASRPGRGENVVLVTGFEPFGDEALNPSWEVCTRLPRTIAGLRVEILRVPCEFRSSIEVAAEAIERHRPKLVILLGQAGGRAHLSVERVAINVDDARHPDNAGAAPVDEAIAAEGPPAYFATIPVKAVARAMRAAGVPAEVSNSAGTYVCNHLMYGVLHFLAASGAAGRAGFIHLPYAEEQVLDKPGAPALSVDTMVKGVEAAIVAASRNAHDIKVSEGTLD